MPSGSHGGGGGGHGFGGSRMGGSSSPKPAFVHRRDIYYPPHRYYFFGRVYSVGSLRYYNMSRIGSWIIFAVFAVFFCGFLYFTNQSDINQIKSDQAYYFNMIQTADNNQYMMADVTGQFEGEGGKYYITYNLEVNGYDLWVEDGYTYAIYTMQEASQIFLSGKIEIVVDRLPLNSNTDSINANYMDFDLSDDGSYIAATRLSTTFLIIGSVAIIALIGCAVYYFKMMFSQQLTVDQKSHISTYDTNEKVEYCLYCGSAMSKNDRKCPQCGSSRSYSFNDEN